MFNVEEREEIQVVIRKEVLIRAFLFQLNKEGLINNKTYLATLEYLERKIQALPSLAKVQGRVCYVSDKSNK